MVSKETFQMMDEARVSTFEYFKMKIPEELLM